VNLLLMVGGWWLVLCDCFVPRNDGGARVVGFGFWVVLCDCFVPRNDGGDLVGG
jgi:hypothetical protein